MNTKIFNCFICLIFLSACDSGGKLYEDCTARSDCASGLACLEGRCINETSGLSVTGASCKVIGCLSNTDCSNNYACRDSVCSPTCTDNGDCSGVCVAGACVDCAANFDCGTAGRCVNNSCWGECINTGECPVFYDCRNGLCERAGCQSDSECSWLVSNPLTDISCSDGECVVGCEADFHCGTKGVCSGGICMDAGCETDIDCKADLYPDGFPEYVVAVECVSDEVEEGPIYANPN